MGNGTASYAWVVEFEGDGGEVVCQSPLVPDWQAATAWACFEGIRRGALPPLLATDGAEVQPVWDRERGAPYVESIRLVVRAPDGSEADFECEVTTGYLLRQIRALTGRLAEAGKLERGAQVLPRVRATEVSVIEDAVVTVGRGFSVKEIPQPLTYTESALDELLGSAESVDISDLNASDMKVIVPAHVFEQAEAQARAAETVETGGFLVGHLHRDTKTGDFFSVVNDQIPAEHTVAEAMRLTFTPESWAAAEAAIKARGRNERCMGWWHFHPWWCAKCPPENRAQCTLDAGFFSSEDVQLHANCFAMADQFALLLSGKEGGALERACFGWRGGVVAARGYHLMSPARD